MKNRKRVAAMGLAAVLAAAFVSGCGSRGAAEATQGNAETVQSADGGKEIPVSEDNVLTIALQSDAFITDYDENYLTKYLEDKLGIDIQFYLLPNALDEVRTKVSLMATSKEEQPDVLLLNNSLTSEMILSYGNGGFFLPLNDYLSDAELMPNYNAIPAEDREILDKAQTQADGNIYSLSRFQPETWNMTSNRMFINKAWLDKLGLSVPTTTEELKEVLIAFRDGDPNGNGIQDEVGVFGFAGGGYGEDTQTALMNAFTYWNKNLALDENGEKVYAPYTTEGWKEGLLYMNDLYREGLLSEDIFTVDFTQYKALLNQDTPVVGFTTAGSLSVWTDAASNKNFLELEMIEPLTGPEGVCYAPYYPYNPEQILFIPAGSKHLDLVLKLADEFYDPYTSIITRYGEEGVDWTREEEVLSQNTNAYVEEGLYDKLTLGVISKFWYENNAQTWRNINPRYYGAASANTFADLTKGKYDPESPIELDAKNYRFYNAKHPAYPLPALHYTLDEATEIQDALVNIPTYVNQSMAEFVTGARDIETEWDAYLQELDSMGLQQWLACAQTAYERSK